MRLQHYLNESVIKEYETITSIIHDIQMDCQPFLKQVKYPWNLLQRGMRNHSDLSYNGVRSDRKPKDTSVELHKMFDDYFLKKFGIRLRSESVFCYRYHDPNNKSYGTQFMIFPVDEFHIYYNPDVEDLFIHTGDTDHLEPDYFNRIASGYEKEKVNTVPNSTSEFMLYCTNYYAIALNDREYLKFLRDHFKMRL